MEIKVNHGKMEILAIIKNEIVILKQATIKNITIPTKKLSNLQKNKDFIEYIKQQGILNSSIV